MMNLNDRLKALATPVYVTAMFHHPEDKDSISHQIVNASDGEMMGLSTVYGIKIQACAKVPRGKLRYEWSDGTTSEEAWQRWSIAKIVNAMNWGFMEPEFNLDELKSDMANELLAMMVGGDERIYFPVEDEELILGRGGERIQLSCRWDGNKIEIVGEFI